MRIFALVLAGIFGLAVPLLAAPVRSAHTEAELVSEVSAVRPGQPFWVALRLTMDPEWHTYWRNPGDSGTATTMSWQLPPGTTAGPIAWPMPELISAPPLASYGYEGEVYLLTEIRPPSTLKPGEKLTLKASVEWLECKEECLPGLARLELALPVSQTVLPTAAAVGIAAARNHLPVRLPDWRIQAAADEEQLLVRLHRPEGSTSDLGEVHFFPEQELVIEPAAPQVVEPQADGLLLRLKRAAVAAKPPRRLAGVLTSEGGWRGPGSERALAIDVALEPPGALSAPDLNSLLVALGFALLGGLILNLMPCVLPVLSIKVLSFVQEARTGNAWRHGLVFTLGVLMSFWALAGVLIALRAGGEQLGWGFQLQSPPFLVVLCAVLFLFGLNLFGVFEVGTSLSRLGGAGPSGGYAGSFTSGVLATAVATPCTAPFMGSALGYALTQPAPLALLIFSALGLGMSAPYLLLACNPALLRFVPRPGAWMESFKQGMGFLLMGTVVWLAWVLGQVGGVNAQTLMLATLVVLGAAAWVLGRWGHMLQPPSTRLVARLVAAAAVAGGVGFALVNLDGAAATATRPTHTSGDGIPWEPFSPERVSQLRAAGTPVFIDFTAAWCLSCQVNERVAFSVPAVREAFRERGIVTMKADWTRRDATITRALAEFGRSGVPLYVLYGGAPRPQILPEVLTPDIVLKAIQEMS